jgi:hypothetical protein
MFAIVEASARLGRADVARQAYDLLLPHADLPVMASLGVACLGSARRAIGVAARTFGDLDTAVGHLERAIEANRRLENRPLVAISQADLADVLGRRQAPGDLDRAGDLRRAAVDEATAMGLTGRLEDWREPQARVTARPTAGAVAATAVAAAAVATPVPEDPVRGHRRARQGLIRREGRGWRVGIDERHVLVGDLVGMRYLAELLTHPTDAFPALALVTGGPAPSEPPRHELLDEPAQAAYIEHARTLAEELADAEADNDLERAGKLRVELDTLVGHLAEATGLAGRSRTFVDPAERARTAVRKAIMRAIDQIEAADPEIAHELRATVTTGYTCSYTADPARPVRWSAAQDGDERVRWKP